MKNQTMIVVIMVGIAILGIGMFTLSKKSTPSDSMMKKDEAMMPKDDGVIEPTEEMMKNDDSAMEKAKDKMMASSRYVEYSKAELNKAISTRRVLFFYASWCPTCRPADASFKENENKIPEDVTLIRVNYNDPDTDQEEKDLAKKYGVTYQHTYVQIDPTGKEVTKWNGGQIEELLTNIK